MAKLYAYFTFAACLVGHGLVIWAGSTLSYSLDGPQSGTYYFVYSLMVIPMLLTGGLVYFLNASKRLRRGTVKSMAKHEFYTYLATAAVALSLTINAALHIRETKSEAGYNFSDEAKKRMERHKTDLFKGRLQNYKDPNPDKSHVPYEERNKSKEGDWEDEDGNPADP